MSTVFDEGTSLLNFVQQQGHGVKGLADRGVAIVPQKYIRPPCERIDPHARPSSSPDGHHQPIDLTGFLDNGPRHQQVADEIVRAAETLGFFQVVNHGVPMELLENVKAVTHKFFEQPAEKKAVYARRPGGIATYTSSCVTEKEPAWDWRDSLTLDYTTDAEAIMENWPSECRGTMLEYLKASRKVAKPVLEVLLGKFGMTEDDRRFGMLSGFDIVHMNYYPPCPNPELTVGNRCHSDKSTLSTLLQDGVGGLSMKVAKDTDDLKKGEWIDVPPINGALVIIVGDILQILSNGRYVSVEHRVRTTKISSRVSIAVLTNPILSEKIGPLPLAIKDDVAFYREVSYMDYLVSYVSEAHTGRRPLDFVEINSPGSEARMERED